MPNKESVFSELNHIIESHILALGSKIKKITPYERDIESENIFELLLHLLRKKASEGLLRDEAEDAVMKLLNSICNDDYVENIEDEIRIGALNNILCSIVGFCSPPSQIWE